MINITLEVSTRVDCPLLEDKKFQKLLNKFTFGSVYAYPNIPGTCVSGENLTGTVLRKGKTIEVDGNTESAQRIFPEAIRNGDSLFMSGISSKTGEITLPPPAPLDRVPFKVTGTICVKK